MSGLTRRCLLRGFAGSAALVAFPSLLSACGGNDDPMTVVSSGNQPDPTGTAIESEPPVEQVRMIWGADVGTLTPFQVSTAGPGGAVLLTLIYDTLTWKDTTGIIPWLGTGWEISEDATSYTFQVTGSAVWHDGEPLTADDVAFAFNYYAQHPYKWMATGMVSTSQVTPDGEAQITLKRPYAAFLEEIAGIVPIVPRHIWEPVTDPIAYTGADASTGSGPFTLAEYDQPQGAYRLLANNDYWRGKPLVKEWRQFTVPPEARIQTVLQGEADLAFSDDASVRDLLDDSTQLQIHETAPLSLVRLVINTERAPLDRKEVRQAIAYALDRVQIAETMTQGTAITGSSGVIPPETPWHNPSLTQYEFDPDRARELLGGEQYTLELIADPAAREPELLKPMLETVGITLNVQQADAATRFQLLDEGNFEMVLTQHIAVGGDPDFLRRWYAGEEANAFARGSIFQNDEFARLGEDAAAEADPVARREIVFQMQEILAEELPTIVLFHLRFYWIYNPGVFTPLATWGGLMNGIPFPNNKLALLGS